MPTIGQVQVFRSSINTYVALLCVGSFALGASLLIWHTAYGKDPLSDSFYTALYEPIDSY